MQNTCKCGTNFETAEKRLADGRGKYCSKKCMYMYRSRPSGGNYRVLCRPCHLAVHGRKERVYVEGRKAI